MQNVKEFLEQFNDSDLNNTLFYLNVENCKHEVIKSFSTFLEDGEIEKYYNYLINGKINFRINIFGVPVFKINIFIKEK